MAHPPKSPTRPAPLHGGRATGEGRLTLLHDLQVHQEELQAQNEELRQAHVALEESRDRYVELYDFAPNGYLTVDPHGMVLEVNQTALAILDTRRDLLLGKPLLVLMEQGCRGEYLEFLRRCRSKEHQPHDSIELQVRTPSGPRFIELLCRPRLDESGRHELLLAMLDVGTRKALEEGRARAAAEHAQLVGRLLTVQEDERRRIARDIHDHLGQLFTGLRLKLELLTQDPRSRGVRSKLCDAQRLAEELDASLDFFTGRLRPSVLDDVGLEAALAQLVREWSGNFGIKADFHTAGFDGERLAPDAETHLYRVCQEALNNVYKHAQATHVAVILERRGDRLLFIVEDNGQGFAVDDGDRSRHNGLGLVGMHERAALIGARIHIESTVGRGTTVFLQAPCPAPTAVPAVVVEVPPSARPRQRAQRSPRKTG